MKNFLSSTKGKIIAGAVTLLLIAGVVVLIILLNTGYRNIRVADLTGTSKVTVGLSVSDAFRGQNLKSGESVEVFEKSTLTLALDSDKHVVASELTKFSLEAFGVAGKDSRTIIHLKKGNISNEIDNKLLPSESYVVESPNASMSVRGTIFTVNVFFDSEGLCHTTVEVKEGVVELTEKGTEKVITLNAGESAAVVSRVDEMNNENSSVNSGSNSNNINPGQPVNREYVFNNPEILAVEQAIETYLNGGELDTTNFDRITSLKIYGNIAFVKFEDVNVCGKGINPIVNSYIQKTLSYKQKTGEKEVVYEMNSLTNLDFLPQMNNLRVLHVVHGNLNDISGVVKFPNLVDLTLDYNDISDISQLAHLNKLNNLQLSLNHISDISPLENLQELKSLTLDSNEISDISCLSKLTELTILAVETNEISDISPLKNLTKLSSLFLGNNNITDITVVKNMSELSCLSFYDNNISDISPVSSLTKLESLYFFNNNISDISALSGLKLLDTVFLSLNPITDYSPLYNLPNVKNVYVGSVGDDKLQEIQQAMPGVTVY